MNFHLISRFVGCKFITESDSGLTSLESSDDGRKRLLRVGDLVLEDRRDAVPQHLQTSSRVREEGQTSVAVQVSAQLKAHRNKFHRNAGLRTSGFVSERFEFYD